MTAYYSEFDPKAAACLRELIKAGLISPGEVDERSIDDVRPNDLRGFTQCHFFAGIGVWSYALRRAGWPDDRPVWTGSCPCQPFSAAGKGGGFADERHLWPAFHHLIRECGPDLVFGEQVASKDGLGWLDLIQTDMERTGYACGAVDLCAAGVGAPHIRQRLWWVAERVEHDASHRRIEWRAEPGERSIGLGCGARGLADPAQQQHDGTRDGGARRRSEHSDSGTIGGLGNNNSTGLEGHGSRPGTEIGRDGPVRPVAEAGEPGWLADAGSEGRRGVAGSAPGDEAAHGREGRDGSRPDADYVVAGHGADRRPGPVNGHWRDADWLFCRDGKWRPVEPGTFPLAHGAPARVGRLRGYGNAIVAEAAIAFIEAYLETRENRFACPECRL